MRSIYGIVLLVVLGVASEASASHYKVRWNASVGAASYNFYECDSPTINCSPVSSRLVSNVAGSVLEATPPHAAGTVSKCHFVTAVDAAGNETKPIGPPACTADQLALLAPGNVRIEPVTTAAPQAPTSLVASTSSDTSINLSWIVSPGTPVPSTYRIEHATTCAGFTPLAIVPHPINVFTHSGLTSNSQHCYQLRAANSDGTLFSAYTNTSSATTSNTDATAPSTPGTPVVTVASPTSLNLSWTASTDSGSGVARYDILQCSPLGCVNHIFTKSVMGVPPGPATTVTGLSSNTGYSFKIQAFDGVGNASALSPAGQGTTSAGGGTVAPATVLLRYPQWFSDAIQFGSYNCLTAAGQQPGAQIQIDWDMGLTAYNFRDYFGTPIYSTTVAGVPYTINWDTCAANVVREFRDTQFGAYTGTGINRVPTNGPAPWNNYSDGIVEHAVRTGDAQSRQAAIVAATTVVGADLQESCGAGEICAASWDSWSGAREVALSVMVNTRLQWRMGQPHRTRLDRMVLSLRRHINAYFIRNGADVGGEETISGGPAFTNPLDLDPFPQGDGVKDTGITPFMVGAGLEALIEFYDHIGADGTMNTQAQIKTSIKLALDGLWQLTWKPQWGSFCYDTSPAWGSCNSIGGAFPGLNNFVSHAYSWYVKNFPTDPDAATLTARGDTIFNEAAVRVFCYEHFFDAQGAPFSCQTVNPIGAGMTAMKFYAEHFRRSMIFVKDRIAPNLPLHP
jgi:Fibronectin type III domain